MAAADQTHPHLTEARVLRALQKTAGCVQMAALRLNVSTRELQQLLRLWPGLRRAALEREARILDDCEAAIFDALRFGTPRERLTAAGFIVRRSSRWRRPMLGANLASQSPERTGEIDHGEHAPDVEGSRSPTEAR